MIIQWYPGHMTKAFRLMEKEIKIVDVILYVLDSRAPFSCVNPKFESLVNGKPIIYVFNKYDMSDKDKVDKCNDVFKVVWIFLNAICGAIAVYCIIVMIFPMLAGICACKVRKDENTFENKLLESEKESEN